MPAEKRVAACPGPVWKRQLHAYEHYLRDARGLASATIVTYVPFIRQFLTDCFGDGPITLSHLRASDVVGFVQRQAAQLHQNARNS